MLGKLICEESGTVTGTRVLTAENGNVKVEVSVLQHGKILGLADTQQWTYWSGVRPDGTMYGEGKGLVTLKNGDTATAIGQAVGRAVGKSGAVKYRGAIYFYSKSRRLSPLNKMATVMEYDVAADGTVETKLWEWK